MTMISRALMERVVDGPAVSPRTVTKNGVTVSVSAAGGITRAELSTGDPRGLYLRVVGVGGSPQSAISGAYRELARIGDLVRR
jgi:hypothetical protein